MGPCGPLLGTPGPGNGPPARTVCVFWPRPLGRDFMPPIVVRLSEVGACGTGADSSLFTALPARTPPKLAKTHRFLGVCVLAPSERSYPRGWSTGRVPLYRGAPDVPRPRSHSRWYGAIFCPQTGKKGRNSRDIPYFARGSTGPKSCPLEPLCYSRAVASDTPPRLCSTFGDPCDEIVTAGGIRGGISARSRANPSGFWHF